MGFVFDAGDLDINSLTTPGAYVELQPEDGLSVPEPSNAIAFIGTGSWGPLNQAMGPFGRGGEAGQVFGQFDVEKWKTDPYDLMRGMMQALGEAQTDVSLHAFGVRIDDGTSDEASVDLNDTTGGTPLVGITLDAKWTGVDGNTIKAIIGAAGPAHTYDVLLIASIGGLTVGETYRNIKGSASGVSVFWANLKNVLLHGDGFRGPTQLIGAITMGDVDALNPAVGTFSLAGGTDGRSGVTAATFFGSDTIGNRQGVYALRGLQNVPAYFNCLGMRDTTKAATLQALTLTEVMRYIFPLAAGTSTSTALSTRSSVGISDKRFMYAKDDIYWTDPISGQVIFTDPVPVMMGRAGSLSPELSPLNKQVFTVVGTEHPAQYPADEIGQLNSNGIWVITNPCLGSPFMGIASASTTSLNPLEQPVEYERLKDYIGINFAKQLGKFVGRKQGIFDPDATRSACKSDIDSEMDGFQRSGLIEDWESQVDKNNNVPNSVRAGYMRGRLEYIPFFTVKFVVLDIATSIRLSAGQAFAQSQIAA